MAGRPAIEIALESVRITGAEGEKAGNRLVTADLIWPRPGIAVKRAVLSFDFEKDGTVDLADSPWHRRILFKEIVEGRFAVSVGVSGTMLGETARELMAGIAGGLLTLAGQEASVAIGGGAPGGILNVLAGELGGGIRKLGGRLPPAVAAGAVDLDPRGIAEGGIRAAVALKAPSDVIRFVRVRRAGRAVRRREVVLAAGAPIGECVICAGFVE